MELSKCWKIGKLPKILVKMKKFKTFYEAQKQRDTLTNLFSLLNTKASYVSETKIFWRSQAYRHLLFECFKNKILGSLEMVKCKCVPLTPTRNMFAGKSVKWVTFLVVLLESIFYNFEWVEVLKMSKVFQGKVIVKWVILFANFSCFFETFY